MAKPTYTQTLIDNNKALLNMNKMLNKLNSTLEDFGKTQREITKRTEKAAEAEDDLTNALERRTQSFNKAKEALEEQGKNFEIFSRKTLKVYQETTDGANIFEFLDLALSNTSESVKIFGFEAANVRKIMYGFLPRGMFRQVNKLSTAFRFLGGIRRRQLLGSENEEPDGIFENSVKGAMKLAEIMTTPAFKLFSRGGGAGGAGKKGAFTDPMQMGGKRFLELTTGKVDFESMGELKKKQRALSKKALRGTLSPEQREDLKTKTKQLEQLRKMRTDNIKRFAKNKTGKLANLIIKSLPKFLMGGLVVFGKIILGIVAVMVLAFFIYHTFYPAFKDAFQKVKPKLEKIIGVLGVVFGFMVEGFKKIYNGFIEGDLVLFIEGILQTIGGIVGVVLVAAGAILATYYLLLIEYVKVLSNMAFEKIKAFFEGGISGIFSSIKKIATIVAIIVGIIVFIASGAFIAIAAAAIVYYLINKLPKWLGGEGRATGGVINERVTLVGERGPELITAPAGSRVHTNAQTKRMMGGTTNNFHITINAKDTSNQEMRRIADEIGRMVSSKINRSTSSSTFR